MLSLLRWGRGRGRGRGLPGNKAGKILPDSLWESHSSVTCGQSKKLPSPPEIQNASQERSYIPWSQQPRKHVHVLFWWFVFLQKCQWLWSSEEQCVRRQEWEHVRALIFCVQGTRTAFVLPDESRRPLLCFKEDWWIPQVKAANIPRGRPVKRHVTFVPGITVLYVVSVIYSS